ncbi:phage GP46 family protein [Acinetobacter sp. B5B]|uniref:phage GP46 family protein n=1 Tax=Acinetobacter baretiae TaxID=2605383 RepID=UPI0018C1FFB9|nr:phage GP46 family protein [Acinetobacter baretiae]MBF7683904.1 phage GP46 family protein [Acinetobacter baretiae]
MANINLDTKDYVLTSLDAVFTQDDVQCICQRLNIHRGKYWANPNLGSQLHTLKRSKDVPRMLQLVQQYAQEALNDLVPSRLSDIVVSTSQRISSRIDLNIEVTRLTGQKQNIAYFVAVGG